MVWVKIDDSFYQHPKVVEAGPLAIAMQVAALCHCNRNLTGGFVSRAIAPTLLNFEGLSMRCWMAPEGYGSGEDATWGLVVEDLVAAGLWEPVTGGWIIHDYEDYQPPATEAARRKLLSAKRADAGRKGGRRSGEVRSPEERSEHARRAAQIRWDPMLSKPEANAQQPSLANGKQNSGTPALTSGNGKQTPSNEAPDPVPEDLVLKVVLPEGDPSTDVDFAARQQQFLEQLAAMAKAEGAP